MKEMKLLLAEMELAKMSAAATLIKGNAVSREMDAVMKVLQDAIKAAQQQIVIEQSK